MPLLPDSFFPVEFFPADRAVGVVAGAEGVDAGSSVAAGAGDEGGAGEAGAPGTGARPAAFAAGVASRAETANHAAPTATRATVAMATVLIRKRGRARWDECVRACGPEAREEGDGLWGESGPKSDHDPRSGACAIAWRSHCGR